MSVRLCDLYARIQGLGVTLVAGGDGLESPLGEPGCLTDEEVEDFAARAARTGDMASGIVRPGQPTSRLSCGKASGREARGRKSGERRKKPNTCTRTYVSISLQSQCRRSAGDASPCVPRAKSQPQGLPCHACRIL